MSKFRKGETSVAVVQRKSEITQSIIRKAEILEGIAMGNTAPDVLLNEQGRITKEMVHNWTAPEIGIHKYARNTAHATHNQAHLGRLLTALIQANLSLNSRGQNPEEPTRVERSDTTIRQLKADLEKAHNVIGELYRAYMQLSNRLRESENADGAHHDVLKSHAAALGRARLRVAKE